MQTASESTPPKGSRFRDAQSLACESNQEALEDYRAKLVDDMAHSAVSLGDEFLDEVLKMPKKFDRRRFPKRRKNPFITLKDVAKMNEREISAEMTRIINTKNLTPGLNAALCENSPDSLTVDKLGQKVDSALFPHNLTPTDSKPHWADQLLPIEYKRHQTRGDPFDDTKTEVAADAKDRKEVRGQIISYAELVFAVQQRAHLIMILIMGRKFRLLHWDRSGVTVSSSIDYYEQWEVFCEVLRRISFFARSYPEKLGIDPSATRIHPDDPRWEQMDDAGKENTEDADYKTRELAPDELTADGPVSYAYVRRLFSASLKEPWPRYELDVPDGQGVRKFLVGRPYFRAKGMTGRGTRGYVALDTQTKRFVWLKDAWRAHYTLVTKEGDILAQLNAANVSNIPTLVCHGDILEQTTKTPEFWELVHSQDTVPSRSTIPTSPDSKAQSSSTSRSKRKRVGEDGDIPSSKPKGLNDGDADRRKECPLRRHIHYRIVVQEVCLPLSFFENGQQLVSIIYHCAMAHYEATQKGILHRDISSGNILIFPRIITLTDGTRRIIWRGILTDWEMAKGIFDPRKPRQPERTGTWQYMSVALLNRSTKAVEIPDDIESLFYVLLYHAVRYLKSNCTSVPDWLEDFFDVFTYSDGEYKCGHAKRNAIQHGELIVDPDSRTRLKFNSSMDTLINRLLQAFQAYYKVKQYDEAQKNVHRGKLPAKTPDTAVLTPKDIPLPLFNPEELPLPFGLDDNVRAKLAFRVHSKPQENPPTQEERRLADEVTDPKLFLVLLREFVMAQWTSGDREGDQVPADWVSTKPIGPTYLPANTSNKRSRRDSNVHSLPAIINAESPTRPRKGRSKKA